MGKNGHSVCLPFFRSYKHLKQQSEEMSANQVMVILYNLWAGPIENIKNICLIESVFEKNNFDVQDCFSDVLII